MRNTSASSSTKNNQTQPYQLISAYNGNDGEGLDANRLGAKLDVAILRALVTQDNKRMNISVEVVYSSVVALNSVAKRGTALRVSRAIAATVTCAKGAIAINIHVDKLATFALEIYDTIRGQVVTAIAEIYNPLALLPT